MDKKDIMELKKRFKKNESTITTIYSFYYNYEGEQICYLKDNLLKMKDDKENDFHKFLDIQKKTLSLKSLDLELENDIKSDFIKLNKDRLNTLNIVETFINKLKVSYLKDQTSNFLVTIVCDTYDIPAKTTDGFKTDESEEVYQYIICSICPVILSKAGLGYLENKNTISSRIQDFIVNPPEFGFVFPAFIDRSSDDNYISYFHKNNKEFKNILSDILNINNLEKTEDLETLEINKDDKFNDKSIEDIKEVDNLKYNNNNNDDNKEKCDIIDNEDICENINDNILEQSEENEIYEEIFEENNTKNEIILEKDFENEKDKKSSDEAIISLLNKINNLLDSEKQAEFKTIDGKKFLLIPVD